VVEAGLVTSADVEGLDVVEQVCAHLRAGALVDGSPDVADLVLEGCPKGPHRGVAEAVADAAASTDEAPVMEAVS
jgi:hypothetical protein